jgi:hypothetical protein
VLHDPLDAARDYVAVVMDDLKAEGGAASQRTPLATPFARCAQFLPGARSHILRALRFV